MFLNYFFEIIALTAAASLGLFMAWWLREKMRREETLLDLLALIQQGLNEIDDELASRNPGSAEDPDGQRRSDVE